MQAAREISVAESNIRYWLQHRMPIFAFKVTKMEFTGPQKERRPEVDKEVLKYIQKRKGQNFNINLLYKFYICFEAAHYNCQ